MALAQAEIAKISDSMSLSEDSSDFSWVSQIIFPGPYPLVHQKPKKYIIFPEGHHRGQGPAVEGILGTIIRYFSLGTST